MSDQSTQTTAADAEREARREPTEHYISGTCPSTTRRSLLGALAFVCALVGPIAVRAEIVSVPSAEVVSVKPADPPNPAAPPPLPTVLRGTPPSAATSVPTCPSGYTLSGSACVGPSGGDRPEDGPLLPSQIIAQSRMTSIGALHVCYAAAMTDGHPTPVNRLCSAVTLDGALHAGQALL